MTFTRTALLATLMMSGLMSGLHDAEAWDRNNSSGTSQGRARNTMHSGGCTGTACGNGGTTTGSNGYGYNPYQQGGGVYVTPGDIWPYGVPNGQQQSSGPVSTTCVDNQCNRLATGRGQRGGARDPDAGGTSATCMDGVCNGTPGSGTGN
ncbi:conserved hypothetical protein [Gluconacetobacter diazotrophicus PA1 5]|nr:hypothetical protein [Gluconacetobacter diazotrophicus]ACI50092.1 conserved hypothetical protein [Gluconacetobacter diazotrophicus PA1 5]MBB2156214.1 hypothetical protein [Gluconacetobacter diazotrophicus]TWB07828.1 hypothetical protein FBZ86_10918 [Gluconacetobacter diazotrophicus]